MLLGYEGFVAGQNVGGSGLTKLFDGKIGYWNEKKIRIIDTPGTGDGDLNI